MKDGEPTPMAQVTAERIVYLVEWPGGIKGGVEIVGDVAKDFVWWDEPAQAPAVGVATQHLFTRDARPLTALERHLVDRLRQNLAERPNRQ